MLMSSLCSCSLSSQDQQNYSRKTVNQFLDLLVSNETITLNQYTRFYGSSSEQELEFELRECIKKGWEEFSNECIKFTKNRWKSKEVAPSLFFLWVKNKFSTIDKRYEILSTRRSNKGFEHVIVEASINNHKFILVENLEKNFPTGIIIGISAIDGYEIHEYLDEKNQSISHH